MNSLIVVLIFTIFSYSAVHGQDCQNDNPCELDEYFTPQRGYQCIQVNPATALCTCPIAGGYETNRPCRLCNRFTASNVCNNNTGRLVRCLEIDDYDTSYACLCDDGFGNRKLTTNANCDTTVTLTTPSTTTVSVGGGGGVTSSPCFNGGVFYNGGCQCPSGFGGTFCEQQNVINLCENIRCKNNGVCAVRNPRGPYEGVCLCRYGTSGDYCELTGTLGFCLSGSCLNGAACKENTVGTTRHAYCHCAPGYNGVKCENRYFTCQEVGKFPDEPMFDQGKYFECTRVNGVLRVEEKSCPKGLRFNRNAGSCTL